MKTTLEWVISIAETISNRIFDPKKTIEWEEEQLERLEQKFKEVRSNEESLEKSIADTPMEDINKSIKYLKNSAINFQCPVCRGVHVEMARYLLSYDCKTGLIEKGVPHKDLDAAFNEQCKPEIEQKIEELKRELNIDRFTERESRSAFAGIVSRQFN